MKSSKVTLTAYDPETGLFTYTCAGGSVRSTYGSPHNKGYLRVRFEGRVVLAHRLAIYLATGEWPADGMDVDHRNGDRTDNRLDNLRVVTRRANMENQRRAHAGSKSGILGVYRKSEHKWVATICVNGNNTRIGCFPTADEARAAYLTVKRERHDGCTI